VISDLTLLFQTEFEELVFAAHPESVLDVGCGQGGFLRRATKKGIRAVGIDANAERVSAVRAAGLEVFHGTAVALPFENGSFDYVVCERSAHHFSDLTVGLSECFRVARSGVYIFDPWFDETIPSQTMALQLERWMKRVDTAQGHVNRGPLSANDFLHEIPQPGEFEAHITHRLVLRDAPLSEARMESEAQLKGWDGAPSFRTELEQLLSRAATIGLTRPGAIFISFRRKSQDKSSVRTPALGQVGRV
jgi:SAM-dependent methyltransferase